jgi:hypothetical protein
MSSTTKLQTGRYSIISTITPLDFWNEIAPRELQSASQISPESRQSNGFLNLKRSYAMSLTRPLIFTLLMFPSCGFVCAQERWQRLPRERNAEFYAPRNKLEELESRNSTLLIKGRTWVATLRAQTGTARVEATEIRDIGGAARATGVTVTILGSGPTTEARCLIDYEEIDDLVRAFDALAKADDSITKLSQFEGHYRTLGDFEIIAFKQTSGGIAAAIEGGFYDRTRLFLTLEELTKLRWMIVQAKEKVDEIK